MKRPATIVFLLWMAAYLPAFAATDPEYLPGQVIVQTEHAIETHLQRTNEADDLRNWLQNTASDYRPVMVQQRARSLSEAGDKLQAATDRLSRTYIVDLAGPDDPQEVSRNLERMEGVVYAEPRYVYKTTEQTYHVPNDSMIGESGHNYFEYHRIFDAWDITRGSSDVVIAIVDTGVYYDHPELKNKLWRNPQPEHPDVTEQFPQVENDTIGWNFWQSGDVFAGEEPEQNADPVGDYSDHGTHVAGIAAAEPDNEGAIAGTGYHARYMPVKVGGTKEYPSSVPYGPEGILYAALNGADVINVSFGSPSYSNYSRDVINLATEEMGSLVVAASGNEGTEEPFYPASFRRTLAVGALERDHSDELTGFSTYGYNVDHFAVGRRIYSTSYNFDEEDRSWEPDYRTSSGTSMAAPLVAGIAALVRSEYPDWSPDRVRMQLRNTSESIRAANPGLNPYHLGQGKMNAAGALQDLQPGVELISQTYLNDEDEKLDMGEHGRVDFELVNHGAEASELNISSEQLWEGFDPGSGSSQSDGSGTFNSSIQVRFSENYDLSRYPEAILQFGTGDYSDFSLLRFQEAFYDEIRSDELTVTFASDGPIGFRRPLSRKEGSGIVPGDRDTTIIAEAGFMMQLRADERTHVIDAVRHERDPNRDFVAQSLIRNSNNPSAVNFNADGYPDYDGVDIEMEVYPYSSDTLSRVMLIAYRITNNSGELWNNVYGGIFTDWDLGTGLHSAGYNESDSLHYIYDEDEELYATFAHVGPVSSALAIDNQSDMTLEDAENRQDSLSFGTAYHSELSEWDGFTNREKRLAMRAGIERTTLEAGDLGSVSAGGPFSLQPGEEAVLGFILGWGESPEDLRNRVSAARSDLPVEVTGADQPVHSREEVAGVPGQTELLPNYPNPFNNRTTISLNLTETDDIRLSVYDVTGRQVATLAEQRLQSGRHTFDFDASGLASGVYVIVAETHRGRLTQNVMLLK